VVETQWIPSHETTAVSRLNCLVAPEIAADIAKFKWFALRRRCKGFADNSGELSACNRFIGFKGATGKPSNNLQRLELRYTVAPSNPAHPEGDLPCDNIYFA